MIVNDRIVLGIQAPASTAPMTTRKMSSSSRILVVSPDNSNRSRKQTQSYFDEGEDQRSFVKSFGHLCCCKMEQQVLGKNNYYYPNFFSIKSSSSYSSSISNLLILEIYDRLESAPHAGVGEYISSARVQEILSDLWKFCAMGSGYAFAVVNESQVQFTRGVDATDVLKHETMNYVLEAKLEVSSSHSFSARVINSAMIGLGQTESGRKLARTFLNSLVSNIDALLTMDNYALWKGKEIFRLVQEEVRRHPKEWNIIPMTCAGLDLTGLLSDHPHGNSGSCLRDGGSPCCQVEYGNHVSGSRSDRRNYFLVSHAVETKRRYDERREHSFATKTRAEIMDRIPTSYYKHNSFRFFDVMLENDCLPSHACHRCLSKQEGGDQKSQCEVCKEPCACYCGALCNIRPLSMKTSKKIHVQLPTTRHHAHRLIPRLVHQTYFEPITPEKYPNFSRLVNSWKASGWDYFFFTDSDVVEFLTEHFPPEVREAYDILVPGAYKADLFRYCVLFILGGVYADVDVMLSADLDVLLDNDIGFMVPVDEPGRSTNAGSCLWNGFLAASPGHPFLAKTIEIVVNNIRNRFTSVDIDDMLCPDDIHDRLPDLDLSHSFDLLYLTGPCILGGAINHVLGRHYQAHIVPGELNIWNTTSSTRVSSASRDDLHNIPGRSIVLAQNKSDMGAHRFTYLEKNLIVATTDMPDYDDRKDVKHYSDAKKEKMQPLFGTKDVYHDFTPVHEVIKFVFDY